MVSSPRQFKASDHGLFGLSGSVVSPYFPDRRAIKTKNMAKVRITGFNSGNINCQVTNNSGVDLGTFQEMGEVSSTSITPSAILSDVYGKVNSALQIDAGLTFSLSDYSLIFPETITFPSAPNSYQTIVTQTGTAAPAVSGSFVPSSTYAAGVTFAWARSSAGVYTLTASSAVFDTSGKTGVFVAPLQNLNASVKAVVTSTTVITITTAVQSVAVLGLLGLTTTPTDALLIETMVYVQTYA